jgi:rubrerythrin
MEKFEKMWNHSDKEGGNMIKDFGTQVTLKEVLQDAIQKEIQANLMYLGLRQRVANPAAKEVCHQMADQEEIHRQVLEDYLHGKLTEGALNVGMVVDYHIAEYLDQPEVDSNMEIKDVFLLAANKEKASHDLYSHLASIHPQGHIRHLLEDLAAQESNHKLHVETLYNEVAFPQTDGG